MNAGDSLPLLLGLAVLLPLASFTAIVLFGRWMGKAGILASYVATGAIFGAFVLSAISFSIWYFGDLGAPAEAAHAEAVAHDAAVVDTGHASAVEHGTDHANAGHHTARPPKYFAGDWYTLGQFGKLKVTIGYHIDALTIVMFCMVTLIATLIHFYAFGYMHDELHEVTDHEVTLSNGHHLHRPGRFHRFFQYLSLFCFSMLGLVVAGNIAMVFVFWELVGICSYFLIGFYIERKSASNAANKAFIVNRVGDFGMIIGMMALWAGLGTFTFGDIKDAKGNVQQGIFSQVRQEKIAGEGNAYRLLPPDGMVKFAARNEIAAGVEPTPDQMNKWRDQNYGYWLLVIAGLGIFCGCVGKSAQFPLHVWLPDAMEGPTPVSALVHSATMVAAGVYLVGRFYPVFAAEVLLVIAYTGAITLFLAATIAITATDIKRVLAYSTVSQLGYMMLSLGVGGWVAGLFHLITHAFFKSLLFMCSGSVIHATHTNDMMKMGGLRKKMPWTAYTMLVGCLAIMGAGIPLLVGLSGYYSKDSIVAQALSFWNNNPRHGAVFFAIAAGGAAITAFYMFRLWFLTFAGEPRDHHVYDHAHESPKVMYMPLVILAAFAVGVGWNAPLRLNVHGASEWLSVTALLEQARPAGDLPNGVLLPELDHPDEHASHQPTIHVVAALVASGTALVGFLLAVAFYGVRILNPNEVKSQFAWIYRLLINKWWFDELYRVIFIRPVMLISQLVSNFDKKVIDWFIDSLARWTIHVANFDAMIDRYIVDNFVNVTAAWTWSIGNSLRSLQTGKLRQYVMLIVIGTVALGVLIRWSVAAGP